MIFRPAQWSLSLPTMFSRIDAVAFASQARMLACYGIPADSETAVAYSQVAVWNLANRQQVLAKDPL